MQQAGLTTYKLQLTLHQVQAQQLCGQQVTEASLHSGKEYADSLMCHNICESCVMAGRGWNKLKFMHGPFRLKYIRQRNTFCFLQWRISSQGSPSTKLRHSLNVGCKLKASLCISPCKQCHTLRHGSKQNTYWLRGCSVVKQNSHALSLPNEGQQLPPEIPTRHEVHIAMSRVAFALSFHSCMQESHCRTLRGTRQCIPDVWVIIVGGQTVASCKLQRQHMHTQQTKTTTTALNLVPT